MISVNDIYRVVSAMTPLYVASGLAYAAAKYWNMFQVVHVDPINQLNFNFILPFLSFYFVSQIDPYTMNYKFIGAEILGKCLVGIFLFVWVRWIPGGSFSSSITAFSLCSLTNALIVGVPLLQSMYGQQGVNLVIQSAAIQLFLRFTVLILFEVRKANSEERRRREGIDIEDQTQGPAVLEVIAESTEPQFVDTQPPPSGEIEGIESTQTEQTEYSSAPSPSHLEECREIDSPSFLTIMRMVSIKMIQNPNTYAFLGGIIWSLIANRWHLKMPSIIQGSILIMSNAGSGIAMFALGLFMAFQERIIACGARKTIFAMVLRFIVGPASTAIGAFAMGLRGNVLRIALIQAALPESITAFTCAQEYGLHADILSTAVILGTIVSVPILLSYFTILDVLH